MKKIITRILTGILVVSPCAYAQLLEPADTHNGHSVIPKEENHKASGEVLEKNPVISGRFAWNVTRSGSRPAGYLVVRNPYQSKILYSAAAFFIDSTGEIRAESREIAAVPPGMKSRIRFDASSTYTYPSEDWEFYVRVSNMSTGYKLYEYRAALPVDYTGDILSE